MTLIRDKHYQYQSGLALSGGAARGFAHLGAIKALFETGYKPNIISGTSMGAIIGAIIANGYHPDEVLEVITPKMAKLFVGISIKKSSFMRMDEGFKVIKKFMRHTNIEDFEIPFVATATNLHTGEITYFEKGNAMQILRASASIPIIFPAAKIGSDIYVDGGLLNNLPVRNIRSKCKQITAINVNPQTLGFNNGKLTNIVAVLERSFYLTMLGNVLYDKSISDVYFEFDELSNISAMGFEKINKIVKIGYEATKKMLNKTQTYNT